MRIFASSDETGNVKEVVCSLGVDTSLKDGERPELVQNILQKDDFTNVRTRVHQLKIFQEKYLLAHRLGGILCVYEYFASSQVAGENYGLIHSYKFPIDMGDKPVSLVTFEEHGFAVAAYESLKIFLVYLDDLELEPLQIDLPLRDQTEAGQTVTTNAFVHCSYNPGVFAYGGKDNDLQIVRLFDSKTDMSKNSFMDANKWKIKVLFRGDNVEPDHLDLKVPIWITQILFTKETTKKAFHVITSTRYGHIRKYNTKEDAQPLDSWKVSEKPIITLNFANSEQTEIIITDVHTFVAKLSLVQIDAKAHRIVSASAGTFYKPSLKLLGKFSEGGNTGAIHAVAISKDKVAFGGLDRYLRVFDIQTRKMLMKVYLGTQISWVCVLEDAETTQQANEAAEDDELWDQLDNKAEPAIKKRKRNI